MVTSLTCPSVCIVCSIHLAWPLLMAKFTVSRSRISFSLVTFTKAFTFSVGRSRELNSIYWPRISVTLIVLPQSFWLMEVLWALQLQMHKRIFRWVPCNFGWCLFFLGVFLYRPPLDAFLYHPPFKHTGGSTMLYIKIIESLILLNKNNKRSMWLSYKFSRRPSVLVYTKSIVYLV